MKFIKYQTRYFISPFTTFFSLCAVVFTGVSAIVLTPDLAFAETYLITDIEKSILDEAVNLSGLSFVTTENEREVILTAYSEFDSCHTGASCLMANGEKAHISAMACPREIPLGTEIEYQGKIYTCKDRTALYLNGRYDIFMGYGEEAYNKAIQFGIRKDTIIIK